MCRNITYGGLKRISEPNKLSSLNIPSLPVEEIFISLGESVSKAQEALDKHSINTEFQIRREGLDQFGLSAHWYTIPEVNLDLQLAFEITEQGEVTTRLVDAEYQSNYNFNIKGSSKVNSRIVSKPVDDITNLSLLNEELVLQLAGRIKKVIELYDEAENPHTMVKYEPFAIEGYEGGNWYVSLLDSPEGEKTRTLAAIIIDDQTGEIKWLRTLEDGYSIPSEETDQDNGSGTETVSDRSEIDMSDDTQDELSEDEAEEHPENQTTSQHDTTTILGVTFTSQEEERALYLFNNAEYDVLNNQVHLDVRAVRNIIESRPITTLREARDIPYVARKAIQKIKDYISGEDSDSA